MQLMNVHIKINIVSALNKTGVPGGEAVKGSALVQQK